jgi:hypothetical protein
MPLPIRSPRFRGNLAGGTSTKSDVSCVKTGKVLFHLRNFVLELKEDTMVESCEFAVQWPERTFSGATVS